MERQTNLLPLWMAILSIYISGVKWPIPARYHCNGSCHSRHQVGSFQGSTATSTEGASTHTFATIWKWGFIHSHFRPHGSSMAQYQKHTWPPRRLDVTIYPRPIRHCHKAAASYLGKTQAGSLHDDVITLPIPKPTFYFITFSRSAKGGGSFRQGCIAGEIRERWQCGSRQGATNTCGDTGFGARNLWPPVLSKPTLSPPGDTYIDIIRAPKRLYSLADKKISRTKRRCVGLIFSHVSSPLSD